MSFWEQRRIELGLSQRELAHKLGLSNTAIDSWEKVRVVPQVSITDLAVGYGVSERIIEREIIVQRRAIEQARRNARVPA